MIFNIDNLGGTGLVTDIQPHALPPNAFTDCSNVRFVDGEARRVLGYQGWLTIPTDGTFLMPYEYGETLNWITAGVSKIYVWAGGTETDITPTGLNSTLNDQWTGFVFNGIAVLNNGLNSPWGWVSGDAQAQTINGWDSNWRAKFMRPFKSMLMAFNLTESGTNYPTKYRWSAYADPGALPASWDEADATIAAGSDVIDETTSELIGAEALGDYMVVYTKRTAHILSFIGGQFIIQERPLLKQRGIIAQNCVAEFDKKHFCVGDGDIYLHDGQTPQSILKGRAYKRVFPNICSTNYSRSYVAAHRNLEEMWFCFPESGCSWPNVAAMWNWRYNTWQTRELPYTAHIAEGYLPIDAPTVTSPTDRQLVALKDGLDGLMPSETLTPSAMLTPTNGTIEIVVMESSYQADGTDMICTVERTGLQPEPGDGVWMLKEAYPLMQGGQATLYFGSQDSPNSTPTWEGPYTFTPEGSTEKIDIRVTGRYFGWKATLDADAACSIQGIRINAVKVGTR